MSSSEICKNYDNKMKPCFTNNITHCIQSKDRLQLKLIEQNDDTYSIEKEIRFRE